MNITELVKISHDVAVEKGFYEDSVNIGQQLMLIVSELGEAMEAHRQGMRADWNHYKACKDDIYTSNEEAFKVAIKDTVEDELADAVIRICDLCGYLKIDLEQHIMAKLEYNKTRPYRHGKEY